MKIYLIRHGETEYNRRQLFYGKSDVPLNEKGRRQAELLKKKLQELPPEVPIYTSSLKRTIETAGQIFPEHQKISLKALDEKSFGLWEGLNADQIAEGFPQEWEKWLAAPFEITPSGAEKYENFQQRILTAFEELVRSQTDFVIVGHLGGIRVILQNYYPAMDFWEIILEQGNYTVLEVEDGSVRVCGWNK